MKPDLIFISSKSLDINLDAYRFVSQNRRNDVSLVACIGIKGVVYHKIKSTVFKGGDFAAFMREIK